MSPYYGPKGGSKARQPAGGYIRLVATDRPTDRPTYRACCSSPRSHTCTHTQVQAIDASSQRLSLQPSVMWLHAHHPSVLSGRMSLTASLPMPTSLLPTMSLSFT